MVTFWLKEAFKLIARAKSSFVLSLISMSISVMLIVSSLLLINTSNYIQKKIKQNIEINIFLKNYINEKQTKHLENKLQNLEFINSIKYISKEDAADIFVKETGDDFKKLLDYNPLPASFSITLKEQYLVKDSLEKVIQTIKKFEGVDEIVYKQDFTQTILRYLDKLKTYIFIAAALILLISVYVVYSTIKLIITSKYDEMETMKLVGAKLSTIKIPIIINGMLIGLLGGFLSILFFSVFIYYFDTYLQVFRIIGTHRLLYLAVLLILGPILGLIVSLFSLKKISLKI